jgi:HK97 family phage prohead protease
VNIERRYTAGPNRAGIETRADGRPTIVGYASVFYREDDPGTEYRLWSDVVERIMPSAFDRAVKEDDVRGLFNHDPNQILGRNGAGTLRLSVDKVGLRYEIDPPDTAQAAAVVEAIRRGDVTGSSFGFLPDANTIREERRDGKWVTIVEREAVRLFDVSPVTFPAYESASAGLRAADLGDTRAEVEAWRARQRARLSRDVIEATARAVEICGRRFPSK